MHLRRFLLGAVTLAACCRISREQNDTRAKEDSTKSIIPSEMKITSWNDMPFSGLVQENGTWVGKGYAFYLLELLSTKLNFTYTIVPPKQHVLNTKNGIIQLLYEEKVDMAVAFLPMLPELQKNCTFSTALDESELTVLMKRPQDSTNNNGLLAPFNQTVWLLVLTAVLSMGPIIFIVSKVRSNLCHDPKSENYTLRSCMWFVYSCLLKQGTSMVATTDSTRLLFATWWIFILILTSFYTANLTAFITKPQFTLPIKSPQDIAHKNYKWYIYKGRTLDYLLSNKDYSRDLDVLRTKQYYIFKHEYQEKSILQKVNDNKLFIGEAHYLHSLLFQDYVNKTRKHVAHKQRCTYVIMPGTIFVTAKAFAFPPNSSLVRPINKELMALVEAGIIKREKMKDLPTAHICPLDLRSNERQLRFADLSLTFIVVAVGYLIASLVFVFEIVPWCLPKLYKRRKKITSWIARNLFCCSRIPKLTRGKKTIPRAQHVGLAFDKGMNPRKISPRPLYQNDVGRHEPILYDLAAQNKRQYINGRDYYIVLDRYGDQRLIPIRTPSAFLFQYTT